MATIVESIDINRRPEDVFSYMTDLSRYPEWQDDVTFDGWGSDSTHAGSKAHVTRLVGPRKRRGTEEITDLNPPLTWVVRGVSGPLVVISKASIKPLGDGGRSRVTIACEFEGRGIGKVLIPLVVRRNVRRQVPRHERKLKELLERGYG
jgi:hypothetical protein